MSVVSFLWTCFWNSSVFVSSYSYFLSACLPLSPFLPHPPPPHYTQWVFLFTWWNVRFTNSFCGRQFFCHLVCTHTHTYIYFVVVGHVHVTDQSWWWYIYFFFLLFFCCRDSVTGKQLPIFSKVRLSVESSPCCCETYAWVRGEGDCTETYLTPGCLQRGTGSDRNARIEGERDCP